MKVLHVHNEIDCKGGTEVYLADIQNLLPEFGCGSDWIAIQNTVNGWRWALQGDEWSYGSDEKLKEYIRDWVYINRIRLICIHNLFHLPIIDFLFTLLPVVKFSHSPVIVCPGRDKYWRFSGKPCNKPYGIHCFYHIYSQGCSNRHPKRVISAWSYVHQELQNAKNKYERVIVMSDYNHDRLTECGVDSKRIMINPYFTRDSNNSVNYRFPEGEDRINLLFIGRIVDGKGVIEMINAVSQLLMNMPKLHLNIIGDGPLTRQVKELIKELNLEGAITLHGWLPRSLINDFLAGCHLVLFPSTYPESFGIVGIEALMASKPVVGFNTGGVSTWLKDNYNGFLIAPGDLKGMGIAVERLLNDKDLYQTLSVQGRKMALDNFLPENHINKLIDLFNKISKN